MKKYFNHSTVTGLTQLLIMAACIPVAIWIVNAYPATPAWLAYTIVIGVTVFSVCVILFESVPSIRKGIFIGKQRSQMEE